VTRTFTNDQNDMWTAVAHDIRQAAYDRFGHFGTGYSDVDKALVDIAAALTYPDYTDAEVWPTFGQLVIRMGVPRTSSDLMVRLAELIVEIEESR